MEFLADWEKQPVLKAAANAESRMTGRGGLIARRREVARSFIDWSLGAQEPLWERLNEIRRPVLWCAGEDDGKFRALAERAVKLVPEAELWIAPGAGHRVPWEIPEAFQAKVGEFLERSVG